MKCKNCQVIALLLIFSAKQIIYISRSVETIPLFHEFKMYIENVKKLEYIITKKNEK